MSKDRRQVKVGSSQGKPRIWLEGTVLSNAGFDIGTPYVMEFLPGLLMITRDATGKRSVSRNHGNAPVIDIKRAEIPTVAPLGTILDVHNPKPGVLVCVPRVVTE